MTTESFSLRAGWLIDGSGSPARKDVVAAIRFGRIESIGDAPESGPVPGILDCSTCTVIPCLIDAHVHLFMSGEHDPAVREAQLSLDFEHARPVIARHLEASIRHGVVAVRDGGDYGGHALRFRDECLDDMPVVVRAAGRAWRAKGRYGKLIGRPLAAGQTLAEAIALREEKADHVKIVNSGVNSLSQFGRQTLPQFSLEEMQDATGAARRLGLRTMVHANGHLPVGIAIEAGCDSIEHGFFMGRENLALMAERGVFWVPTAFTMKAYGDHLEQGSAQADISKRNLAHQVGQLRLARELGVSIAVGTDAGSLGVHHGASYCEELGIFSDAGFGIEEIVGCATSNGARLLGLEEHIGRLEPGMPATFVVVEGEPSRLIEALRSPKAVVVRGALLPGACLRL